MEIDIITPLDIKYSVTATEKGVYEYALYLTEKGLDVRLLVPSRSFAGHDQVRPDYKTVERRYRPIKKGSVDFMFVENYYYSFFHYFNLPKDCILFMPFSPYYYFTNILFKPRKQKYIIGTWNMHLYNGRYSENHKVLAWLMNGFIYHALRIRGLGFLDTLYFQPLNMEQRAHLIKTFHIKPEKIFYIPLFVDPGEFRVKANSSRRLRIVHIGGVDKNASFMSEIMKELVDRGLLDNFEFWFIGGRMPEELSEYFRRYDTVVNYGKVSDIRKAEILSDADALVITSVEGFGLKMLEALASGLEVVCLDNPACDDIEKAGMKIHTLKENSTQRYVEIFMNMHEGKHDGLFSIDKRRRTRKLVQDNFSREVILPRFLKMVKKVESETV